MTRLRLLAAAVPCATALLVAAPADATQRVGPVPSAAEQCEEGRTQYVTDTPPALLRLAGPRARTLATGAGITVAVVDSGVDDRNAHLRGAVLDGRTFVGGSPTRDARLHGTAIAGIVAARELEERSGVEGLAPDARILPVKVVPDEQGADEGPDTDAAVLAEGIRWAAAQGAQVVNVSLSTGTDDPALRAAVREATRSGSLVVASAGTRRSEDEPASGLRYPAAYPDVLGVAAVDADDRVAPTSVAGEHVDLAAPGVEVLTTFGAWGDCYLADDGSTSYATAYVSAAAALVAQRFPREGPAGWAHRLEVTAARQRRDARDDRVGWGVVQPVEALTAVLDPGLAGPLLPGASPEPSAAPVVRRVDLPVVADPRAADRRAVVWVAVGGTAVLVGLALVRLVRRRATP